MSTHTKLENQVPVKGAFKRKPEKKHSWRELFKEDLKRHGEAGLALRGLRAREGLTQKQLAERIHVSQHHISEMENRKRAIGKEIAKRLEKEFNISYKVFL